MVTNLILIVFFLCHFLRYTVKNTVSYMLSTYENDGHGKTTINKLKTR